MLLGRGGISLLEDGLIWKEGRLIRSGIGEKGLSEGAGSCFTRGKRLVWIFGGKEPRRQQKSRASIGFWGKKKGNDSSGPGKGGAAQKTHL